jgi:hypothetical protein
MEIVLMEPVIATQDTVDHPVLMKTVQLKSHLTELNSPHSHKQIPKEGDGIPMELAQMFT